ncbi:uncharacterized protein NP_0058A [Natronomonas pharaonis DSM 2160]|uniref:Uncharacterized protein n=1 Tax=Natronomonas pharaonis (strain ATCC 35678 / DSM 2160 / CIP 103997 / JCM 8858 / NBRC 14720 / NCIMB 2260 / Gabara) TaxID=348780 RepID=A0A1U7ETA6_NATPD|nr:hypothetical protein [Natronomonas pharaonis]CAI48120.1 uncharacterized protein NP_0058A [Natronomonas pharaonis DSM 2160]
MAGYYEQLLGAILASLLMGALASLHAAVTLHEGLVGGSLVATLFLYEALFRNPPVSPRKPAVASAAFFWHLGLLLLVFTL